jgi:hypothetical protein
MRSKVWRCRVITADKVIVSATGCTAYRVLVMRLCTTQQTNLVKHGCSKLAAICVSGAVIRGRASVCNVQCQRSLGSSQRGLHVSQWDNTHASNYWKTKDDDVMNHERHCNSQDAFMKTVFEHRNLSVSTKHTNTHTHTHTHTHARTHTCTHL